MLNIGFNSIKVQLEHPDTRQKIDTMLFQFHKGSIRTTKKGDVLCRITRFNSIKVQLELTSLQDTRSLLPCFNSIKVQLERMGLDLALGGGYPCFNSIKVQLEQISILIFLTLTLVSIP